MNCKECIFRTCCFGANDCPYLIEDDSPALDTAIAEPVASNDTMFLFPETAHA